MEKKKFWIFSVLLWKSREARHLKKNLSRNGNTDFFSIFFIYLVHGNLAYRSSNKFLRTIYCYAAIIFYYT
jgi:hypothetical protein